MGGTIIEKTNYLEEDIEKHFFKNYLTYKYQINFYLIYNVITTAQTTRMKTSTTGTTTAATGLSWKEYSKTCIVPLTYENENKWLKHFYKFG